MPGYFVEHSILAAVVCGQVGEEERARAALLELNAVLRDFGALARAEFCKWFSAEHTEHLVDGLGKAGPEVADKKGVALDEKELG